MKQEIDRKVKKMKKEEMARVNLLVERAMAADPRLSREKKREKLEKERQAEAKRKADEEKAEAERVAKEKQDAENAKKKAEEDAKKKNAKVSFQLCFTISNSLKVLQQTNELLHTTQL
jgi:DnaJ homolog subfamily C member 2